VYNINNKLQSVYKNSILIGSKTATNNPNITINTIQIGRNYINTEYFNGDIDDFRIYDRALTADQIQELYKGRLSIYYPISVNADLITQGTTNRFITNDTYNRDITFTSNVNVLGNYQLNGCNIPFSVVPFTTIKATNANFGYNSTSNNFGYYSFNINGTIDFSKATNCDLLIVGAGGNGGIGAGGGGGGAGEVIAYPNYLFNQGSYQIQVGINSTNSNLRISKITSNSSDLITAKGGGDGSKIERVIYTYTGSIQTFNVPNTVTQITMYCWGAGGGGNGITSQAAGGDGGFVKATLNVSSISSLKIVVGQGGRKGTRTFSGYAWGGGGQGAGGNNAAFNPGSGGGLSGIFVNDANITMRADNNNFINTAATPIIIAGAGGGAGNRDLENIHIFAGGNGGSNIGNDGSTNDTYTQNGKGGTQIGGGAGGDGYGFNGGNVGDKFSGGSITLTGQYGGGGGAGWYGGGSGGTAASTVGGGGGGSSYINTGSYQITNITNLKTLVNNSRSPPGNNEINYISGIAVGGLSDNDGGNGLVVIEYMLNTTNINGSGGSGGGSYLNLNNQFSAGTLYNSLYSYATSGSNGTLTRGGNGGSALFNIPYTSLITGSSYQVGQGGTGSSSNTVPVYKTLPGSGGDGNGGLGSDGIVIIKVPLDTSNIKFDGLIHSSNIIDFNLNSVVTVASNQLYATIMDTSAILINKYYNPWIISGDNIYNQNVGNVGIGTNNPRHKLDVVGNVNITGNLLINSELVPFTIQSNTNVVATNGIYSSNINNTSYGYYYFLTNGSIRFPQTTLCDIIVVGAGGNGGIGPYSGGGGAGEVIAYPNYSFGIGTYGIQVGLSSNNSNLKISKITSGSSDLITAKGGGQGESSIITVIYNYTGSIETFTVPLGVTELTVYCWGAGGGAGDTSLANTTGGDGGFVKATINVTSISSLKLVVGQGGRKGNPGSQTTTAFGGGGLGIASDNNYAPGSGGGLSGIFVNNNDMYMQGINNHFVNPSAIPIIISGAGGGNGNRANAGNEDSLFNGGNGGSLTGNDGSTTTGFTQNGKGGTQAAGGAGGTGGIANGTSGNKFQGGNGNSYGGGGGAGWYGGGAGGVSGSTVGGGGGGSSYINVTYTTRTINNDKTANNNSRSPPGTTESVYQAGIAVGGAASGSDGGNGLIVIQYISQATSGGSGGGSLSNLSTFKSAGSLFSPLYSYATSGSNGTLIKGGDGGSALSNIGYTEIITGTSLILGVGGTGATSNSMPLFKNTYGSGGDGNGGLGTQGIIIIKVPLNTNITRFDGYINYNNVINKPVLNELISTNNYINLGYYNQVNFPLGNVSWKNEWFLYVGTSPSSQDNSFIFWHSTPTINSKWWFNGSQTSTNAEISDSRIKKEVTSIQNPLNKLMMLKPKEYYLCDEKDYLKKYGIIAQEVANYPDLSHLVYKDEDYIANIFTEANYFEVKSRYFLRTKISIIDKVLPNDELKLLLDNINTINKEIIIEETPYHNRYKKRFVKVKGILDINTIEIYRPIELTEAEKEQIFIYGKKVQDFNKLDYSSLYSLNLACTQELYKIIQEQRIKIDELERRIIELEKKFN